MYRYWILENSRRGLSPSFPEARTKRKNRTGGSKSEHTVVVRLRHPAYGKQIQGVKVTRSTTTLDICKFHLNLRSVRQQSNILVIYVH